LVKSEYSTEELTVIRHFVDGPLYAPENSLRQLYYYPGTSLTVTTPTVWFDGTEEVIDIAWVGSPEDNIDSTRTLYREKIEIRRALPSPVALGLAVEYPAKGDTGTIVAEVIAEDTIAFQGLVLRLAVTESGIDTMGIKDQILRDYLPDAGGISFTIAQGDTFTHSQPFIIDAGWTAENCDIVAFVQDDTTREVLQAVQAPVITPAPAAVSDLGAILSGDDLVLTWSPVSEDTQGNPLTVDHYLVYRDTVAFRDPGSDPFQTAADTFWVDDTGVVGDTGKHYFYWIAAVADGKESDDSPGAGEFDTGLMNGK
jgi:hypothetical protein